MRKIKMFVVLGLSSCMAITGCGKQSHTDSTVTRTGSSESVTDVRDMTGGNPGVVSPDAASEETNADTEDLFGTYTISDETLEIIKDIYPDKDFSDFETLDSFCRFLLTARIFMMMRGGRALRCPIQL